MAVEVLLQKGWHLTPDGLEECKQNGNKSADAVIKAAQNIDLRDIGEKFLPDDINRGKVDYVQGPCVLQIQKLRNVSAPKENEESQGAPRLLKLTLTDGHQNCGAVEIEPVDKISLNTPPGSKVQLLGTVQIEHGFLLLNNKNTRFVGGTVEKMVESWKLKRSLAKQSRVVTSGEGAPPPFVPFGQRITHDRQPTNRRENFKSLEVGKEKKEEDGEFEQQRQATIAEALQNQKVKTFGGMGKQLIQDKDVAKIVEMGFSSEEAMCALKQNQGNPQLAINALLSRNVAGVGGQRGRGYQRGPASQDRQERSDRGDRSDRSERSERSDSRQGGRGRRNTTNKENEVDDLAPTRPSGPATLFDFLETKMTIKDEPKTDTKDSSTKSAPSSRPEGTQGYQGRVQSAYTSKSQSHTSGKFPDHRPQGQGFSQNRRQNLPPRLANKYNREADMSSGRPSQQRAASGYHGKQADSGQTDRNSYTSSRSHYSSGTDRNSYSDRNSYGGSERSNYGSDRNNYTSDRNNYRSERNQYGSSDRSSGGSERNNYSGSDRNSNKDRSGRDRGTNNAASSGSDRSQGRTNSYRKPDFSNPPPTLAYETGQSSQYSSGQYGYPAGNPGQSYRPNTVAYSTNYNNVPGQNDWGQTQDFQTDMSSQGYMQNNGERGTPKWRRGDKCLAQYSGDGQFYSAVIEALCRELPTCVVTFTEYGNSEEVSLDSLRPVQKYSRTDGNWQSGGTSKMYSSQQVKHQHHQSGMVIPQGMAYAPPIAGDESLFAANHITTMEFRRGGGGNSYQKRPDRQGTGRNQPFYSNTGGQNQAPTSHY